MPGVKAAWADTLDRDLLLPECQANEAHRGRLGSLSGTGKYADKGITPCLRQVISNESCQPLFHPHLKSPNISFLNPRNTSHGPSSIHKMILLTWLKRHLSTRWGYGHLTTVTVIISSNSRRHLITFHCISICPFITSSAQSSDVRGFVITWAMP